MTPNEAYRKGQEDMRRRICQQWRNWCTAPIAPYIKRRGRPRYERFGNVPLLIRKRIKVKDLPA